MRLQLLLVPPELAEMQFKNYVGVRNVPVSVHIGSYFEFEGGGI